MGTHAPSAVRAIALVTMLAGCYLTSSSDPIDDHSNADPCEAFEQDLDGDGWGDCSDCDDHDASVHPDVFDGNDPCVGGGNGRDDDCDGEVDEDWIGMPQDGCGVPDPDEDGDGWLRSEECNDRDPAVNPGVWEDVCCQGDGIDNDCDGQIDESMDSDAPCGPCDVDRDGDGWPSADDCDDLDATRNPGRTEYCCPCGGGWSGGGGDGDADADADADADGGFEYPDCNGIDDDCDGVADETSLSLQAEDEFCCNY